MTKPIVKASSCPYCKANITDAVSYYWDATNGAEFDFDCPECGKTMSVYVEVEQRFLPRTIDEQTHLSPF